MAAVTNISYWLFQSEVWLILALVLIIADVIFGLNFFVLPVGIAAVIVSALLFAEDNYWFSNTILLENWRSILITFAALSLVSVFLIRKFFQRKPDEEPDINDY